MDKDKEYELTTYYAHDAVPEITTGTYQEVISKIKEKLKDMKISEGDLDYLNFAIRREK